MACCNGSDMCATGDADCFGRTTLCVCCPLALAVQASVDAGCILGTGLRCCAAGVCGVSGCCGVDHVFFDENKTDRRRLPAWLRTAYVNVSVTDAPCVTQAWVWTFHSCWRWRDTGNCVAVMIAGTVAMLLVLAAAGDGGDSGGGSGDCCDCDDDSNKKNKKRNTMMRLHEPDVMYACRYDICYISVCNYIK
jgi:hypothetical protein